MSKSFKGLPTELVWLIYEYLSPTEQFNVSCTSKHFTEQSKDILAKHKSNHAVHHRASDRTLKSLEYLLQLSVDDQSAIWHLRTFDVLSAPSDRDYIINNIPGDTKFDKFVAKREVSMEAVLRARKNIVNDLREQMEVVAKAPNPLDEVCRKALEGRFDAYEVLILALSPNLQAINFVNFPRNRTDEDEENRTGDDWIDTFLL